MSNGTAEEKLERIRAILRAASCNDGCLFWRNEGQHTNGGCRHQHDWRADQVRVRAAVVRTLRDVRAILEEA